MPHSPFQPLGPCPHWGMIRLYPPIFHTRATASANSSANTFTTSSNSNWATLFPSSMNGAYTIQRRQSRRRKTGIAVRHIEQKSGVRARRKKSMVIEEEEVDKNGEQWIRTTVRQHRCWSFRELILILRSFQVFPLYTSARQHETPTSIGHVASSSRIVAQTPEMVLTDPSPRRRSLSRGSMGHVGQGRSSLSMGLL
jgi:hypothetical protein